MQDAELKQEPVEVRDPAMAVLLVNPKALAALTPFLGQELSLSEAALRAGLKLPSMTYWVKKLLATGLLRQTRRRARAGSAVAYYQSIGGSFYVPFALLPAAVVAAFQQRNFDELQRRLDDALVEVYGPWGGAWGLRIGLHATGKAIVSQVTGAGQTLDPAAFAAFSLWDGLLLHPDDARNLQRDLYAVLQRYRLRPGSQTYLVRIAVAPIEP